jgi:outer membrane protein assembly factor BamB
MTPALWMMCTGIRRHLGLATALLMATVAMALSLALAPGAHAAAPAWVVYHHDPERSAKDPDSTSPLAKPESAWQTPPLDGHIYAEPLVYGSHVFVATENDTIYALNSANGEIAWQRHVGTAVPIQDLGLPEPALECTNIETAIGITSTPVIDAATNTVYAVANAWNGSEQASIHHELVALDLTTGAMRPGFPIAVDPEYPSASRAAWHLQRPALALDGNEVLIGYGSYGDCQTWWGWLVAAPTSGVGPLKSFQVDSEPEHEAGSIWGSGNAPYVAPNGDIYVATGNGNSGLTKHFDFNDSVLEFSPTLELLDWWAPSEWEEWDQKDLDLGSSEPIPLPGGLIFQIGKKGEGFLFHANALGKVGGTPAASLQICVENGNEKSYGGGIYVPSGAETGTLYVNCLNGFHAVSVNTATPSMALDSAWTPNATEDEKVVGPPIYAGGLIWVASWFGTSAGTLFGLDPTSGAVKFHESLGKFMHFATPSAGGGRLFVANSERVTALSIATPPAPSPTTTSLASSANPASPSAPLTLTATVSPAPDGGTVSFSEGGAPIAGCAALPVDVATSGLATCPVSYATAGTHLVSATYSGDPYYTASVSSPLNEVVGGITGSITPPAPGPAPEPAPELSHAAQSQARWREGNALAQISGARRLPVGTTFTLTLNEAASVHFTFTQETRGRRRNGRCVAAPRHHAHVRGRAAPCTFTQAVATLDFGGHAGVNQVRFDGRVSQAQKLKPGAYTLSISASNAAGSGTVPGLRFTIVKG